MPFCSLSEDVSLHYIVNMPSGNIADLDPAKATILCIPYMFFDVTWLREQFGGSILF